MIIGAHAILYTTDAEADRAFFKDVLEFSHVDAGRGWLIFGLPPSEVAIHPAEANGTQQLYFMVESAEAFIAEMGKHGIECSEISDEGWGRLLHITLPSGAELGVYEPRHERPPANQQG